MPKPSWTPPTELEEYRLLRRLGHGAMGQVWLAHDGLLDRKVAIKFLGELSDEPALYERFLTEARAVARLSHPNVVAVHRVGDVDRQPFMVSEWVDGQSLDQVAKPMAPEALTRLAVDLSRGLAAAHRAGVLHRDVKPANAMLTAQGSGKLLDFGLAKLLQANAEGVPPTSGSAKPVGPPLASRAGPADDDATHPAVKATAGTPHAPQNVTRDGAVLGTPLYLAPEIWRGDNASRRSDVFSLGALLYELCAGAPPVRFLGEGQLPELCVNRDCRPLLEVAPVTPVRLAEIIDRCLHRNPDERFANADELREALEQSHQPPAAQLPSGNPYRGLAPFDAQHRSLFFGRGAEVRAVCDRLRSPRLWVVAGESGVGKSSLCRAGVLPAVEAGALEDGRQWRTLITLPGRTPLMSLCAAAASVAGCAADDLYAQTREAPVALARALRGALRPEQGLLLFIDQLEEWVTFAEPSEAAAASRAVALLADSGPSVRVLASARTDLLSVLAGLPALGAELSSALYLLGPVAHESLPQIIEGPARLFGVRFESEAMVRSLVDFAVHPGALPLLQFALERLWETKGDGQVLTEEALARMGGAAGALASHADRVIGALPALQARHARALLTSLVSSEDRRRRVPERELARTPDAASTLQTLARERLVVARDSVEGTTWELAHEALLRAWPTLQAWLRDDGESRLWQERVARATTEWVRLARSREALWGTARLAELARARDVEPRLSEEQLQFLQRSRSAARRRRLLPPVAAMVLALAAGAAWLGSQRAQQVAIRRRVDAHLQEAGRWAAGADSRRADYGRHRQQAMGHFDRGDWPAGEAAWAEALSVRERWAKDVELWRGELDAAQLLAPGAQEIWPSQLRCVQHRLALADASGRPLHLEPELRRLEALGAPLAARSALLSEAWVQVEVTPEDSNASLERWVQIRDRAGWEPIGTVQMGSKLALPLGSYRLAVSRPEHRSVHLPFVVERGQTQTLNVHLLPAARVPQGFVHVPRGSSLVGAAGDDAVRREFYDAAPLHSVEVADFLIGETEVTFAQWLEFVDALPATERATHLPHLVGSPGAIDAVKLNLQPGLTGWMLDLTLDGRTHHRAGPGEMIHYAPRPHRQSQRWELMPVVGVSPLDVAAYLDWLHRSGRHPGARLCTEYEWERAARGADGRTLPHGEHFSPDDANVDITYERREGAYGLDEVGSHPASNSPFGLQDMMGNVWEMATPAAVDPAKRWVTKGGCWQTGTLSARLPNRYVINDGYRQAETGFRVCSSVTW